MKKKKGFVFDKSYITQYGPKEFTFCQDLREFFPDMRYGNNTINDLLRKRGVINRHCQPDSEYSCLFVDFKTERAALSFLDRLNAVPEIKNYVEPDPDYIEMKYGDWLRLKKVVKTFPKELRDKLSALRIDIVTVREARD